ncbi:MAG: FecR domain-containing protein [Bacteroidota bacterium]
MLENNWNLIAKHLAKETNDSEEAELNNLIKENPSVKKIINDSKVALGIVMPSSKSYNKKRIKTLIDLKIIAAQKIERRHKINSFLKIAAVFTGLAFLTFFFYNEYNRKIYYSNNANELKMIVLPDNSVVTLNKNAQIAYVNSIFRNFNREIELEGEAFFKIEKDKSGKQFIVQTNDFKITVLGTEFNVRDDEVHTSVMLTEGSIQMHDFSNKKINPTILKVGEIAIYHKENKDLQIKKTNKAIHTAWLSNKLNFDDFTMQELVEMIKLLYGKTLVIENKSLLNKRISGTAPADNFNLVIKALIIILETDIIQKQDSIILK